ncbi:MAG: hypothetical protein GC154_15815 [bacterium]|nr:hypothetical protein [bacterium]
MNTPGLRKSPWIAGILSGICPGLGQLYNEDYGKGLLFMFIVFFPIIMISALAASHFQEPLFFQNEIFRNSPLIVLAPLMSNKVILMLWLFVVVPVIYFVSLFDAINSAQRYNIRSGVTPSHPYSHPGASGFAASSAPWVGAQTQPGAGVGPTGASAPYQEQPAMNQTYTQQSPPPPPGGGGASNNALTGRLILGVILLAVGGASVLDGMHINVLERIVNLWPLILIGLGGRILLDFKRHRDQGQLILGAVLTFIGAVCGMEVWLDIHAWDILFDSWPYILTLAGVLLIVTEVVSRSRRR